ncbi:transcriptional regulator [Entomomonas moraniae]|uniref:Transcriptional regulator n=1 Tax=Entomomonas moraniae TaxID=2213226 RepID=A0A3Q9JH08_9GAMM|nr:phage terminase large subunit [Entomomonas moraniae]AZS49354.1 transcriptional regulator [Entomomonas moraniae]
MSTDKDKVSFLAFFLLWAKRQGWQVPLIHVKACDWLEHRGDLAVLRCFRGFGKSTILAVYNAWRFYDDPTYRIIHQSETDRTAYKTSRDTQNVLKNHPLTKDLFDYGGIEQWWVKGANDSRNASLFSVGILSNVTGSRANECQNDDVEVPNNTTTQEARDKLRERLDEQTHILLPEIGKKLFIGTPHTHDSIYDRTEAKGADCLTIRMFEQEYRIDNATKTHYKLPFKVEYVFYGIGEYARVLIKDKDYLITDDNTLIFHSPPNVLIDCYAGAAWPERFTIAELQKRRKETETINKWDSQYQLHSKPVTETRLDPSKLQRYDAFPEVRLANKEISCWLGETQIVGAIAYWDCSLGKIGSDASALNLVLTDADGNLFWQFAESMTGELAEFGTNNKIIGGQVQQVRDLVVKYNIPCVVVETKGSGGFVPPILRKALQGTGCAIRECHVSTNKQKRILDALEPPLLSGFIWAHKNVLDGPAIEQMRNFNPEYTNQEDDYIDSLAGAILQTPVRICKKIGNSENNQDNNTWRPNNTSYEVKTDY